MLLVIPQVGLSRLLLQVSQFLLQRGQVDNRFNAGKRVGKLAQGFGRIDDGHALRVVDPPAQLIQATGAIARAAALTVTEPAPVEIRPANGSTTTAEITTRTECPSVLTDSTLNPRNVVARPAVET